MSLAASCMHMLYAYTYFNSKTFSQSEKIDDIVYIGHANATDGGDPANALVTVQSGAAWTLSIAEKDGVNGTFELQQNAAAAITNITVSSKDGAGHLILAKDAVVSHICSFKLGRVSGSIGRLEINGGEISLDSSSKAALTSMQVGYDYHGS